MATEHCSQPEAHLRQSWDHCDPLHERHNAHRRDHCAGLSTPRTVFRCIALMCSYVTLAQGLAVSFHLIPSMHVHVVVWVSSSLSRLLYFFLKSYFHLFLISAMVPDENSMEYPLCNSSFGSMVSLNYVTPRHRLWAQGHGARRHQWAEPRDLQRYLLPGRPRRYSLFPPTSLDVDDNELAEFLAVVVDRTGKPVDVRSNNDHFSCDIRNVKSAQSQFPSVTQPKRMISQTGWSVEERIAEERENSNAQIRTLFNGQRKTIIEECCEKVSHHELQAARAEQDRRILQEELLRQQQDFREVHQQDLMKMKELRKFQNSTFDEFTKQKFIEDQKIIMELSGRLQELQNEVNCMNDSRDFRDAESICSGNSHVTSPPGLLPKHPPFEGLLKPDIHIAATSWGAAKHLGYIRFIGKRFCTYTKFFVSSVSSRIKFYVEENYWRTTSRVYSREKWKTRTRPRSELPIWTVSQRFSHLQWRRLFQELWRRPTTIADFGSSFWQVPYTSNLSLLEDKVQDRGMYLFTISYGSFVMDQGSGVGWFSGWIEIFVIYSWYFNAEFWSTWCEDCFFPEQDHPWFPFQEGDQPGGTKSPERGPFPSR